MCKPSELQEPLVLLKKHHVAKHALTTALGAEAPEFDSASVASQTRLQIEHNMFQAGCGMAAAATTSEHLDNEEQHQFDFSVYSSERAGR